ncbi:MAG: damage-control phosphatase ARMT1 family protein [Candidatus Hadarchaeia archaeon]
MKTYLDCVPCALRQALEASRMATDDRELQESALRKVLTELSEVSWKGMPLEISHRAARMVIEEIGVEDPYSDIKQSFNEKLLDMYPELKQKIERSDDQFLTATKMAIAGNIIDFGPNNSFNVEEVLENSLEQDFAIDDYEDFRRELNEAEEVVYISDNSGEIVLDRLLLEELKDKKVELFVRGSPIMNDAMLSDAKYVGLDEIAEIKEIEKLDSLSESLKERLKSAEVVISKGQANYEAFSEVEANLFFLLIVKCPLIGEDLGAEEGDMIVKWSKPWNG